MNNCRFSLIAVVGLSLISWILPWGNAQESIRPSLEASHPAIGQSVDDTAAVLVASKYLSGANLVDQEHNVIGKVSQIVISRDGSMAHAVVRAGGLLGVGGTEVAVPLQAIRAERAMDDQTTIKHSDENSSWLHVAADLLRAPKLETPEHLELSDAAWLQKNFAFFQVKLPSQWSKQITDAQADNMLAVDELIDGEVFGHGGESLAYLDAIILKLDGNPCVPYAVLGHGGLLGVGKKYVAVDFSKLHLSSTHEGLRITTALDSNGLAAQQQVTPNAYPELRLQSVRRRVDK